MDIFLLGGHLKTSLAPGIQDPLHATVWVRIVILLVILLRPPNDLLQAYITTSVPVRVLKGAHGCILASIFDVEIIPTNLKVFGVFTDASQ